MKPRRTTVDLTPLAQVVLAARTGSGTSMSTAINAALERYGEICHVARPSLTADQWEYARSELRHLPALLPPVAARVVVETMAPDLPELTHIEAIALLDCIERYWIPGGGGS